ncbi:MAG: hypothetical protein HY742_07195 [Deltaproteobacteria bacterium]|nr:hypothetical protein [Deltaproteobacteria bacterium]
MRNLRYVRIIVISVLLFFLVLPLQACKRIEVLIKQDRYAPSFQPSEYSKYKGKSIYLAGIANRAENTYSGAYQSPDRWITYKSQISALDIFFWDCFDKAFRSVGMGVHVHGAPPKGVPEFRLALLSLNDQVFSYKVTLLKDGFQLFEKNYTVNVRPAVQTDDIALEQRAYALIDLAFTVILEDPEFSRNF